MALGAVGAMRAHARARRRRAGRARAGDTPPGRRARDARARRAPRSPTTRCAATWPASDAVREVTMAKLATQRTELRPAGRVPAPDRPRPGARARGARRPARPDRRRHRRDHARDPRHGRSDPCSGGPQHRKGVVTRPLRATARGRVAAMPGVIAHNLFHRVGDPRTGVGRAPRRIARGARRERHRRRRPRRARARPRCCTCWPASTAPPAAPSTLDDRPLRGLDDLELTRLRRDSIGLLLPAASVLPTITVRENVALPLLIARRAARARGGGRAARARRPRRPQRRPPRPAHGRRAPARRARPRARRPPLRAAGRRAGRRPRPRGGRATCSRCCATSPTRTA